MSDIQGTYQILMKVDELLAEIELKITNITAKVVGGDTAGATAGVGSLRKDFRALNMYMIAIQQFTGSDTLSQIGNKIQQTTASVMRLYMLMNALSIAMAGTMGPLGWVYAGANVIGFGMSLQTLGQ